MSPNFVLILGLFLVELSQEAASRAGCDHCLTPHYTYIDVLGKLVGAVV